MSSASVLIKVPGIPQPQGSSTGFIKSGKVVITSANKNLRPWREIVAWQAHTTWARRPMLLGPVSLKLVFFFPRPKGHFTSKGLLKLTAPLHHIVKPDRDKLDRAIGDALKVAGVYRDDAQVDVCYTIKRYVAVEGEVLGEFKSHVPGVRIEVRDGE